MSWYIHRGVASLKYYLGTLALQGATVTKIIKYNTEEEATAMVRLLARAEGHYMYWQEMPDQSYKAIKLGEGNHDL